MSDIKLQFACFLITGFIFIRYSRLSRIFPTSKSSPLFKRLLGVSFAETFFDMATAYSVNSLTSIPAWLNDGLHWIFFLLLDTMMYLAYLYFLLSLPQSPFRNRGKRFVEVLYVINMLLVTITMPRLYYVEGQTTNYSLGWPVYACFFMALFYVILLGAMLFKYWKVVSGQQKANSITIFVVISLVASIQFLFPETLITALVPVFISIASYINHEDPIRQRFLIENEQMQDELDKINDALASKGVTKEDLHQSKLEFSKIEEPLVFDMPEGNGQMKIAYSDFVYAASEGNYLYVFVRNEEGKTRKILVHNTLKVVVERLSKFPNMMQVHRAYAVNLDKVVYVSGNKRALQLYVEGSAETVPVSRQFVDLVRDILKCA